MVVDGSRMMLAAPRSVNASPTSAQIDRADAMVDQLDRDDGQRLFGLARRSDLSDDDADDAARTGHAIAWTAAAYDLENRVSIGLVAASDVPQAAFQNLIERLLAAFRA